MRRGRYRGSERGVRRKKRKEKKRKEKKRKAKQNKTQLTLNFSPPRQHVIIVRTYGEPVEVLLSNLNELLAIAINNDERTGELGESFREHLRESSHKKANWDLRLLPLL